MVFSFHLWYTLIFRHIIIQNEICCSYVNLLQSKEIDIQSIQWSNCNPYLFALVQWFFLFLRIRLGCTHAGVFTHDAVLQKAKNRCTLFVTFVPHPIVSNPYLWIVDFPTYVHMLTSSVWDAYYTFSCLSITVLRRGTFCSNIYTGCLIQPRNRLQSGCMKKRL